MNKLTRIIRIEGAVRETRRSNRPGWNWERLTPAERDRIVALDAKAHALGGLDRLTDAEIEEGALIAERSIGIAPRTPSWWGSETTT